jgi:hypothetical protein
MASTRSMGLALGLALTLAAVWYAAGLEEADTELLAEPAPRDAAPRRAAVPAGRPVVALPADAVPAAAGARMDPPQGPLFAAHSWQPPAPPPQAAAPAPAPQAPALPFRYVGRMEEDGQVVVFLTEGAELRPRLVRQGDLLPNYRVDEVTSQGVRMTYLPLNETQRLLFGNAN